MIVEDDFLSELNDYEHRIAESEKQKEEERRQKEEERRQKGRSCKTFVENRYAQTRNSKITQYTFGLSGQSIIILFPVVEHIHIF